MDVSEQRSHEQTLPSVGRGGGTERRPERKMTLPSAGGGGTERKSPADHICSIRLSLLARGIAPVTAPHLTVGEAVSMLLL